MSTADALPAWTATGGPSVVPPPERPGRMRSTVISAPTAAPATPQGRPARQPPAAAGGAATLAPHLWQNRALSESWAPQAWQVMRWGNPTGRIPAGSVKLTVMGLSFPGQERARQMGELRRGNQHWNVLLETEPDGTLGTVRGRIHFVSIDRHRVTSWIFMDGQEGQGAARLRCVWAAELWQFLEALPD